jgi:hypothetical protein
MLEEYLDLQKVKIIIRKYSCLFEIVHLLVLWILNAIVLQSTTF